MAKIPPPCKCPECAADISLDHLKANLTDDTVKSLWASLGGRARTGRKISPKQQAAMQVTRAVNRLIRWAIGHGFAVTTPKGQVHVVTNTPAAKIIAKRPRPADPTVEQATAFSAWVTETIETMTPPARP